MSEITITNQLDQAFTVYDSYQAADAEDNYYGKLTQLSSLAVNGKVSIPLPHPLSTLIVFDTNQKPLTRFTAGLSHYTFTISDTDVQVMTQADAFVTYAAKNPDSTEAKTIHGLKAAKEIDAFFKSQPSYSLVTTPTYMLALTYRAQNLAPAGTKPEDATYSLSKLITSLSGMEYPAGMPDISISHFFFRDDNGVVRFGGTVDVTDGLPFDPLLGEIIMKLLALTGPVNVEVSFDTNIGLNLAGTQVKFSRAEIDAPLGGGDELRIVKPTVTLTITPTFKFVVFEVQADFPITVFGQEIDTHLSMVVDNVEIEVGLEVSAPGTTLPSPQSMIGVHFDSFGLGMGLIFEPPGYALGIQGSFHIGEGSNTVSLDDDTFVVVLDVEGDVPNPLYLSFYVPKLDLGTVLTALTDVTVDVPIPIEFEELSFTWNENPMEPLALPDGTMSKGGYGFSAYMDLFGLKCYAAAELSLNQVTVDAVMSPVNLAGIFKLTGQGTAVTMKFDAKGDPIRNNVIRKTAAERALIAGAVSKEIVPAGGPNVHVSTVSSPYVKVDGDATFLGVSLASVDITVDNSGLRFDLHLPLSTVACHLATAGNLGGSFTYGPDWTIPLPASLGSIHLQVKVEFLFSLVVSEGDGSTTATFTASGGFNFMGMPLKFGPVSLGVNITALEELMAACESFVVKEATSVFGPIIGEALTWAKGVVNGFVSEVDTIASGLQSFFNLPLGDAAQVLHDAGVALDDAASQLKNVYNTGADDLSRVLMGPFGVQAGPMAELLNTLGFPVADIGGALSAVFHVEAAGAAQILSGLGFPADAIARVLQSDFGLDAGPAARILNELGFSLGVIATAMSGVFQLSPDAISGLLQSIGFSAQDIASAFQTLGGAFKEVGEAISDALQSVGHVLNPENW
jgi:hypothetical protein